MKLPLHEYAKPIYEAWDAEGFTPPQGYESWMDYLRKELDKSVTCVTLKDEEKLK